MRDEPPSLCPASSLFLGSVAPSACQLVPDTHRAVSLRPV